MNETKSPVTETIAQFRNYLDHIERHYQCIQEAWKLVQEKCGNRYAFIYDDFRFHAIQEKVLTHDLSKFDPEEFQQYRKRFYPIPEEDQDPEGFEAAWKHHLANNDHHWQTWNTPNYTNAPYCEIFPVLMIIDWLAMEMEGKTPANEYYYSKKEEMNLQPWAESFIEEILDLIYTKPEDILAGINSESSCYTFDFGGSDLNDEQAVMDDYNSTLVYFSIGIDCESLAESPEAVTKIMDCVEDYYKDVGRPINLIYDRAAKIDATDLPSQILEFYQLEESPQEITAFRFFFN